MCVCVWVCVCVCVAKGVAFRGRFSQFPTRTPTPPSPRRLVGCGARSLCEIGGIESPFMTFIISTATGCWSDDEAPLRTRLRRILRQDPDAKAAIGPHGYLMVPRAAKKDWAWRCTTDYKVKTVWGWGWGWWGVRGLGGRVNEDLTRKPPGSSVI